jgi:DNA-binding NarL/FixJ family response regulator
MGALGCISVLCADDHPLMRAGIASAIHAQIDMVMIAEASTGCEAVEAYRQHRPDVTVMDLQGIQTYLHRGCVHLSGITYLRYVRTYLKRRLIYESLHLRSAPRDSAL